MRTLEDALADALKDPEFKREWDRTRPQARIFKRVVDVQINIIQKRGVKYHRYKQLRKAAGLKEF